MISPFFSGAGFSGVSPGAGFFLGGEIRVEFLQDFLAGLLDIHVEILQDARGDAVALAEQAQEDMLGADIGMVEGLGFFAGEGQDLFDARGIGNVADHLLIGAGADLLFDLHAHRLEIQPEFLEHIDRDALAKFDQPEQKMLGADEIVVEAVGLFARQARALVEPAE